MSDNPAVEAAERATENRRVALLIAALALALALTEVAGDDAKTEAQMRNVGSANI
jgi:response regulator RpfG family c-di-GMP phosphodiesterase